MKVSVVVPVRGRPEMLRECLAALNDQTIPAETFEIVVCDDGSREDLRSVVEQVRTVPARILCQAPLGPAAARNLGIRCTCSPLIVFLDSDVVADKMLLRGLLEALDAHPEWMGAEACLLPSGTEADPLWEAPAAPHGGRYHTAAIAYRREALVAVGGFDEQFPLPVCEDIELAVRVLQLGRIGFVPDAKAFHPSRRVTSASRWHQRRNWRYITILAERYAILAFPDRNVGRFFRLRVVVSAVASLPLGRLLQGLLHIRKRPSSAIVLLLLAAIDLLAGLTAVPVILFGRAVPRRLYLTAASQCPAEHN